ncbi:MAG: hypothetical protein ACFCVD_25125 [Nodosilinea sp.]
MSDAVTLQDIYDLFRTSQAEADRRLAELKAAEERRSAEAAQRAAEADRRAAEADRRLAELRTAEEHRSAEADRRLAELKATEERRSAETAQRIARLEQIAANTSREVAGLTTRWGQFVENLVEPAVVRMFQARGIEVQETYRRIKSQRPGAAMEIDIFAVDGDVAVAIEVKSRLSQRDVDDFIEKLGRFKLAFRHYPDYQIYGAVAAIEIDAGVDRYAYQRGLFVIQQRGDTVAIANDEGFTPASW